MVCVLSGVDVGVDAVRLRNSPETLQTAIRASSNPYQSTNQPTKQCHAQQHNLITTNRSDSTGVAATVVDDDMGVRVSLGVDSAYRLRSSRVEGVRAGESLDDVVARKASRLMWPFLLRSVPPRSNPSGSECCGERIVGG
jgi:hypothetical protein